MGRRPNPALLGAFVVGAVALAVAGLVAIGGGKLFQPTQLWMANFDESIKGLAVGSPVTFRGVRVGRVEEVRVLIDPHAGRLQTPVVFRVEVKRIATTDGRTLDLGRGQERARPLFERGLRAQLEVQSFVTGQLSINLDFHPGTPLSLAPGAGGPIPEMPTIPSKAAALGRSLEELNLPELVQDLRSTVKEVERAVSSPEARAILTSAASTLQGASALVAATNRRLESLGPGLERATRSLDETLGEIRLLARGLDQQAIPSATEALRELQGVAQRVNAETLPAAHLLLGDLDRLARRTEGETLPAATQLLAEARQAAARFVQTAEAGRLALEELQRLAADAGGALDEGSPLRYRIDAALREMTAAARAVRLLATGLERDPDSIFFGKSGK